MKYFILTSLFLTPTFALSAPSTKPMVAICQEASQSWVKLEEAKKTKVAPEKIKVTETTILGSGTMLVLSHFFVDGPNTGDNTHWEVAGYYDTKSDSCKVLTGKRHWEH